MVSSISSKSRIICWYFLILFLLVVITYYNISFTFNLLFYIRQHFSIFSYFLIQCNNGVSWVFLFQFFLLLQLPLLFRKAWNVRRDERSKRMFFFIQDKGIELFFINNKKKMFRSLSKFQLINSLWTFNSYCSHIMFISPL